MNTNTFISSEACYDSLSEQMLSAEEVASRAAKQLLDDIMNSSGIVSTSFQEMAFMMMALSEKKVSHIVIGRLSESSVQTLRLIKVFLEVSFNFESDEEN